MLASVIMLLAGCASIGPPDVPPKAVGSTPLPRSTTTSALRTLDRLEVHEEVGSPRYKRGLFGTPWRDVDRNGCDTRNDILARDLTGERLDPDGCTVLTGTLRDPYTGHIIHFTRGPHSTDVQIDHVVSLAEAWKLGAYKWSTARRTEYANDPLVLLAVDGPENTRKSDKDVTEWLPPRKIYRCAFARRVVAIKVEWHLWITRAEKAKLAMVLSGCPT